MHPHAAFPGRRFYLHPFRRLVRALTGWYFEGMKGGAFLCPIFLISQAVLGDAAISQLDRQGRRHVPLEASGQPLGDVGQWYILDVIETRSEAGATLTKLDDGSILVSGHNPAHDTYTLTFKTTLRNITALRLDTLSDESLPRDGPGRSSNGNFTLTRVALTQVSAEHPDAPRPVIFKEASADYSQREYEAAGVLDDDPATGWSIGNGGKPHTLALKPAQPIGPGPQTLLTLTLEHRHPEREKYNLGRFLLSATTQFSPPPTTQAAVFQPPLVMVDYAPVKIAIATAADGQGPIPRIAPDGAIVMDGPWLQPTDHTLEIPTELERITGLRLEAWAEASSPSQMWAVNEASLEVVSKEGGSSVAAVIAEVSTSDAKAPLPAGHITDGNDKTYWASPFKSDGSRTVDLRLSEPVGDGQGTTLRLRLKQKIPAHRLAVRLTRHEDPGLIRPGLSDRQTLQPVVPAKPRVKQWYFNLGGRAYADPQGRQWLPLPRWRDGANGYVGGYPTTSDLIQDPLLRSALSGVDAIRIALPNGAYRVALIFCENRDETAAGYRRFDVAIEGVKVIRGLDLSRLAGLGKPWMYTEKSVPVKDGTLNLTFTGDKPLINGLAVIQIQTDQPPRRQDRQAGK